MALQVWLPLNGNLNNQGLADITVTNNGATVNDSGKIGECYYFNGSSYIAVDTDFSNYSTTSCSLSCWVKPPTASSGNKQILAIGTSSGWGNIRFGILYRTNEAKMLVSISNGNKYVAYSCPGEIIENSWNHVVAVYNNHLLSLYINGELAKTYTTDYDISFSGITKFGVGAASNGAEKFTGYINDVRIYDHALSPLEVKEISKGLVLHYPLSMPGQENLVKQSNQFNVGSHAAKLTPSVLADGTYQVIAESGNSNYTSSWWMTKDGIEDSFVEGETFTISFTIKSSDANTTTPPKIYIKSGMGYYSMKGKVTDAWSTVYYTGTWKKENSLAPHLGWSGLVGTYHIMNWKIERGSRPTPWLPNQADTKYTALGFNDGIEYDVSGYRHNGTKYGTLTYSSDTPRYNTSTVFNGTDNCIKFPFNDFCTNGDIFTMNIWWKKTELGSKNYETLIGGPSGFEMDTRSGSAQTLSLYMASTRGGNVYPSFNMGEWYMITLVNDGTNELYYVNGVLVKTIEKKNMPTGNYYVGAWQTEAKQNFQGNMSDFKIYKTALSAEDVYNLYAVGASISDTGVLFSNEVSEV